MTKQIQKASGDIQEFSSDKLSKFLTRIKVPQDAIDNVVRVIETEIHDYTRVNELRQAVTDHLLKLPKGELYAARYNIKTAVRKLGPAGHFYESYVGELFKSDGFENVHTSVVVQGECVTHELDVVATKDGEQHMVECKFHNQDGTKSDVTIALYIYARFLDVQKSPSVPNGFQHAWLSTNTKLTQDAIHYCMCKGMKVLTMEYPYGSSILDKVVEKNVFPISTLNIDGGYLPEFYTANYVMLTDILSGSADEINMNTSVPKDVIEAAQNQAHGILAATA